MRYEFDWDPVKERQNIRKHHVSFRQAATVFRDPNQLSIYDEEHSEEEDRWITMGKVSIKKRTHESRIRFFEG